MSLSDVGNAYEIDQHGKVKTEEEIKKERRLRGLCQLCGETKTHERNAFGIRKQLNVDGLSFRGHCLLCYDVKRIGGRWQVIKRPRRLNRSGNGGGTAMPTAEVRRATTTPMPATTTTMSSSSSNGSGNKHTTTTTQGLPSSYNFTSQSSIGSTGVGSISSSTASSSTQSHPSIRNSGSKIPGMCFKPKISFHVKSRDCTTSGSNDSIIPSTPTKIISDDKALSKLSKATSLTQITHILNESSKSAIVCNRAFAPLQNLKKNSDIIDDDDNISFLLPHLATIVVACIKINHDDVPLVTRACAVLWRLSIVTADARTIICRTANAISEVLQFLSRIGTASSTVVVSDVERDKARFVACGTLASLLNDEIGMTEAVTNCRCVETLSQLLLESHLKVEVKVWAMRALMTIRPGVLRKDDAQQQQQHVRHIVNGVESAMSHHLRDCRLQEWALRLLMTVLSSSGDVMRYHHRGLLSCVLAAMEEHGNDPSVQYYALGALASMTTAISDDEATGVLCTNMINTMERYIENVSIQEQACRTLSNLCCDDGTKMMVLSVSAVEAISAAIVKHKSARLFERAYDFLTILYSETSDEELISALTNEIAYVANVMQIISQSDVLEETSNLGGLPMNLCLFLQSQPRIINTFNKTAIVEAFLTSLRVCKDDPDVAEALCDTLAFLATGESVVLMIQEKKDLIYDVIQQCGSDASVQTAGFYLLERIYTVETYRTNESISESRLDMIIQTMNKSQFDCALQEQVLYYIHNMTIYCPNDCCELIEPTLNAIQNHQNNVSVLEAAMGAMWSLTSKGDGSMAVEYILSLGGVNIIINSLGRHKDAEEVLLLTFGFLSNCSTARKTIPSPSLRHFVKYVLYALTSFQMRQNVDLQLQAMKLLSIWAKTSLQLKLQIAEYPDALEAITDLLDRHGDSKAIATHVFFTLSNLCVNNTVKYDITIMSMKNVIVVMEKHNDPFLQDEGISLLCNTICACPNELLIDSGATKVVIDIMMSLPDNVGLQEKGIGCLWNICYKKESNKEIVVHHYGVNAIVNAMANHPGSAHIIEKASVALWCLSSSPVALNAITSSDFCQDIVLGLLTHINAKPVQTEVLGLLLTICAEPECRRKMQEIGGNFAVVHAMAAHYDDPDIQEKACHVLCNIAVDPEANRVSVLHPEELSAVIVAMKVHEKYESVQRKACLLLKNYSFGKNNMRLMYRDKYLKRCLELASMNFPETCMERAQYILEGIDYMTRMQEQ